MRIVDLMRLAAGQSWNRLKVGLAYRTGWNITRPNGVSFAITNRCNLRCPTCGFWKNRDHRGELVADEIRALIDKLRDWLGPFAFNVGGGEPLLRSDLWGVIDHARARGCYTGIVTNGHALDENCVKALDGAGLNQLSISLNSLKPVVHDRSRGRKGSFARIMRGLDLVAALSAPPRVKILAILMEETLADIAPLVRFVEERGLAGIAFQPLNFTTGIQSYRQGWFHSSSSWPRDGGRVEAALDELREMRLAGAPVDNTPEQIKLFKTYFKDPEAALGVECKVGVTSFNIDPFGKVRLCYTMKSIGDVRSEHPRAIWEGEQARHRRVQIKACTQNCRLKNCNFSKPIRHFLPLFAEQITRSMHP